MQNECYYQSVLQQVLNDYYWNIMKLIIFFIFACAIALIKADDDELNENKCPSDYSKEKLLPHEEFCNKYYQCTYGNLVARICPLNLVFDPKNQICTWPIFVNCGNLGICVCEENNNENGDCEDIVSVDNGGGDSDDGDVNTENGTNDDPSLAKEICKNESSDGTLIANECCNKFYKCYKSLPVPMFCPANLNWNTALNLCDWPKNVDCGGKPICENQSNGDGNEPESDSNNGDGGNEATEPEDNGNGDGNDGNDNGSSGGNSDPSQAQDICKSEGSDGTLIANECCNKFYKCYQNVPVAMFCPANLNWNTALDLCDWPENVDCGGKPICENQSNGDGNEPESDSNNGDGGNEATEAEHNGNGDGNDGNDNSSSGGNSDPSQAQEICKSEGSDGTLIANECCNKFYKCYQSVPVAMFCPANLNWNTALDLCDWPENVDCGGKPICENQSNGDGNEPESDSNNGDGGNEATEPEDNGNGDGNDGNDNSSSGGNSDPSQAQEICKSEGSDGTLIANECCNKFYKCDQSVPVAMFCPANLNWNTALDLCDWPENVDCGGKPICENQSNGDGNEPESDSNNGDGGNEATEPEDNGNGDGNDGNDNGSSGGNSDPSQAQDICKSEGSDGTLIANECCNKFYKCYQSVPVAMFCPANLNWNTALDLCDWPENVDCGGKPICENQSNGDGNEPESDSNNGDGGNEATEPEDNGNGDGNDGNDNGSSGGNSDPSQAHDICKTEGSDGTLIANECCNKFYKCYQSVPVAMFCPANLNWNTALDLCDWPENVDCGGKPICENQSNGDENEPESDSNNGDGGNEATEPEDNGNGDGNDGNDNGSSGGNSDPSQAQDICKSEGSDGTLIANECCNKFYKCDQSVPVAMFCPANLNWNTALDLCDWPENVDCGGKPICENQSNGDGIEPESDSNNGDGGNEATEPEHNGNGDGNDGNDNSSSGGNSDPSQAQEICKSEGSDGTLIANECCNKFYKCYQSVPVAMFCPANLNWNTALDLCDWPENVDCGGKPICENQSNGDGNEPESDSNNGDGGNEVTEPEDNGNGDGNDGNDNSSSGGNSDPSQAHDICKTEGSDGTLIANECCNKFYKCYQSVPVAMFCPANLNWNTALDLCDWPKNVDCGGKPICENQSEDNEDINNDNGNDNAPETDTGNGGTCNCIPREAPVICGAQNSEHILVAHEKCNKFYICISGNPIAMDCPNNLLYNPYSEQCDWPESVHCGDRTTDEGQDNSEETTINEGNEPEDNGNKPVGGNSDPSEALALCAASGSDGELVAHNDCNKFYKCFNGLPWTFYCPDNLYWSTTVDRCDWRDKVDCVNRL